uniref:Conserved secreted protein n=1 Tax=Haemonchus contortus TaxID=6289 RepID=A0A7I4YSK6_HAECO
MSTTTSRSMIATDRRPTTALAVALTILIAVVKCENRVPTLNEISRFNDPVLSEVFSSSGIKGRKLRTESEDHPELSQMGPDGEIPTRMSRVYVGEVPNNHNQPLGPIPQMPNPMVQAVDTGVNVLANGANALYRGAASVGQAFGFNAQAYEGPLFSTASQLLGKK